MDMLTVDLSKGGGSGDSVELFGDEISVNEVAAAAGTIPHEIVCAVKRAQKIYR